MSKNLIKEIKNIALGTLILGVVQAIGTVIIAYLVNFPVHSAIWGTVLGCTVAILNFSLMGIMLERCVTKGKGASGLMGIGYILRLVIIALAVVWAMKVNYLNYLCTAVPLLFPRITIFILNFIRNRERKSKTDERT